MIRNISTIKRLTVFLCLCLLSLLSLSVNANANDDIEIVVSRSAHTLSVMKGNKTLEQFKVSFGSGGKKAKQQEGDYTTPKGDYLINKVKDSSNFHVFMLLNYPNLNDARRAFINSLISRKEYRAILLAHREGRLPPQNTALGGAIGIHGIGVETEEKLEIHQIADWTKGCIAMRNDEIDTLKNYIVPGTRVSIND